MGWDGEDRLISIIKTDPSLGLSPVMRQVILTRLEHPTTDAEIARARDEIMGRITPSLR